MSESKRERLFAFAGLVVETIALEGDKVLVSATSSSVSAVCPCCGRPSRRVHSRYQRRLADLPAHGRWVEMVVATRRFRCAHADCARRIFAERLDPGTAASHGRRTDRLEGVVHHLGMALGGRPAQAIARRLLLPVSKDTLLRTVRRRAPAARTARRVIGIDDWAWRKGHRYGTLICDLERREIIDLLPDREPATVAAWLEARPSIEIIARDRGGGYGAGAAKGRPEAVQVADRWHLFETASAAFLLAVKRRMRDVRRALGHDGPVDLAMLTAAERLQHEGWQRRADADAAVLTLHREGVAIKEITRRTGRSRTLVRDVVRGGRAEPFRPRASSLEPWLDSLNAEWDGGCRNGAELWRRLRADGFPGALRVVTEWATRRRRDEGSAPARCPGSRTLARLLTLARDTLTRAEAIVVAAVTRAVPEIIAARETVDAFHRLIRSREADGLDPWIEAALASPVASFARGVVADRAAVAAAIALKWSNGQTEGNICRLKTLKRQMGGRANLDLLKGRLMPAA